MSINKLRVNLALIALFLLFAHPAKAIMIATYDLQPASGTSLAASAVTAGFSATNLTLNNPQNTTTAFSNHFYHNGWDTIFNAGKYYEMTLSSASLFTLDTMGASFSLEELGGAPSTYWLRSSLDGFSSDLGTGQFSGGQVTDFSVDLTALGVISSPITFRWYMTADNLSERAGFANHELPGTGGGLPDVGQDLIFSGSFASVPEPGVLALLSLGLLGIGGIRKYKSSII